MDTLRAGFIYSDYEDGVVVVYVLNEGEEMPSAITVPSMLGGKPVRRIADWGFYGLGAVGLTSVTLPSTLTSIGEWAFTDGSGLTSVTLPAGLKSIGNSAFGNTGLTNVTIPSSVTSIGIGAFSGCTNLTNLTIQPGLTSIGLFAFAGCRSLANVTIPPSVTSIEDNAFQACGMASMTIPSSVTTIGPYAFASCPSLTSITLPSSVTSIGENAFFSCSSTTSISVDAANPMFSSSSGVLFNKSQTTLIQYPGGKSGGYAIPTGVTIIRPYAFSGTSNLPGVVIPSGVESIGLGAFGSCSALAEVVFEGNAPTTIGSYAFEISAGFKIRFYSGALGFTTPTWNDYPMLPLDFVFIANETGSGVTITGYLGSGGAVVIPATIGGLPVLKIADHAFFEETTITSVVIPTTVTSIEEHAFSGCTGLTSVTIPSSVATIGESAFAGCTALASATIQPGVTTIGESAFTGCTALTSVTIPSTVTHLGEWSFAGCTGMTSLTISPGVTHIGSYAFSHCSGLTSVTIPASVTELEWYAFFACSSLNSVTFESGVTHIGSFAFYQCTGLIAVEIPSSVTHIGESAFSGCTALTSATFQGNAPATLGTSAFASTATGFTIYYHEGATGFASIGYPTLPVGNPGGGFTSWSVLASLPADRRGPEDRNGPLALPNLLAYAMGLDPLAATPSDLPAVTAPPSEGRVTFRYRRAKNAPGVTLTPMTSATLAGGWSPATILDSSVIHDGGAWETVEIEVPAPPSGPLFFRLDATQS